MNKNAQGVTVEVLGRGETLEVCFADAAAGVFTWWLNITDVQPGHIITFDFEESDIEQAFLLWLDLLFLKAVEHRMVFAEFRLKREGKIWRALAAGQKWPQTIQQLPRIQAAADTLVLQRVDHHWEVRCSISTSSS